jgi:RHH-type proline utilization regulon transcriptional repressor/proline dehydrogenase/delta 1-pyrroline-5-carboxylate dehydrogenase
MAARDLEEAVRLQNGTPFGLTGGIHTLDPSHVRAWLEQVQVGNAYVNRHTTGAIVQRQPFGGWKRSVVGPGAKTGGPNYVAQLGRWVEPSSTGGDSAKGWMDAARRSDAYWQAREFGVDHDPSGVFCEANVLRYVPLDSIVVRAEVGGRPEHVLRAVAAARAAGCRVDLSVAPGYDATDATGIGASARVESAADLERRLAGLRPGPPPRIRVIGEPAEPLLALRPWCYLDDRPVLADGRIEGLRYRREQAVSRTLHRFGNLVQAPSRSARVRVSGSARERVPRGARVRVSGSARVRVPRSARG